jgi:N-acetylneuraminic acid mutarotase
MLYFSLLLTNLFNLIKVIKFIPKIEFSSFCLLLFQESVFAQLTDYQVVKNNFTQFIQPETTRLARIINWQKTANMPSPKAEAGSVVYNGKMYVFGGITGFIDKSQTKPRLRYRIVFNNTAECFDPQTHQWTSLKPKPGAGLSHYGICLVDDKVWFVGGRLAPNKALTEQVWLYDLAKDTWDLGPNLPLKLASGALLKLGRKLHFFAGGTHSIFSITRFNTLTKYHLVLDLDNMNKGWQVFDSNFPLEAQTIHASYVNWQGKFYLIGGQDGHDGGNQDHQKVFEYNPANNAWRRLANLPQPNSHNESSTFVVDGRLLNLGGEHIGSWILEYERKNNRWLIIDTLRNECGEEIKLIGTSAKVLDNQLIIAGGGLKSKNYNSISETFIKHFTRKPLHSIGFLPDTLKVMFDCSNPQIYQKSAWLWAEGGKTPYTLDLTKLPAWIQLKGKNQRISDGNSDELELSFNPQGLAKSIYYFPIMAQSDTGESSQLIIAVSFTLEPTWIETILSPWWIDRMLFILGALLIFLLIRKFKLSLQKKGFE